MESASEILERARKRAIQMGLPYSGAVTPAEAGALITAGTGGDLVDVRTRAEWEWVGRIPGAVLLEWNSWPSGARNPDFERQLIAKVPDRSRPVFFLCRSGGRSHQAASAAAQLGYTQAFNVLEGFEGDKDANGHRGTVGGWKAAGLPWIQG